jgi:hypothetical protein
MWRVEKYFKILRYDTSLSPNKTASFILVVKVQCYLRKPEGFFELGLLGHVLAFRYEKSGKKRISAGR